MCLGLQSSFLYLCNCCSSQHHPHLKAQRCVGSTLSCALGLIFTGWAEQKLTADQYLFHAPGSAAPDNNFILTPSFWWTLGNSGTDAAFRICGWIKTIALCLQRRCCRTVFWDVALSLTFHFQSAQQADFKMFPIIIGEASKTMLCLWWLKPACIC